MGILYNIQYIHTVIAWSPLVLYAIRSGPTENQRTCWRWRGVGGGGGGGEETSLYVVKEQCYKIFDLHCVAQNTLVGVPKYLQKNKNSEIILAC